MKSQSLATLCVSSLVFVACGSKSSLKNPANASLASPFASMRQVYADVGLGVSAVNSTPVGECITGTAPDANILATGTAGGEFVPDGQVVEFDFREVSSSEEVRSALNISANGKGSWGFTSASARANLFSKHEISSKNLNMIMHIEVTNPEVRMHNVRLTPEAVELLQKFGSEEFTRRCGVEAVIGYQTGASFSAIATFSSKNSQDAMEMMADLKAKGVNFSGGLQLAASVEKALTEYDLKIAGVRAGGKGDIINLSTEELKKEFSALPKMAREHAVPIRQITIPFKQLIAGIDSKKYRERRMITEDLAKMFDEDRTKIANLRVELNTNSNLSIAERESIEEDIGKLSKNLQIVMGAVEDCEDLTGKCALPEGYQYVQSKFSDPMVVSPDPVCGVESFKEAAHPDCGQVPETYYKKDIVESKISITGPMCGVKEYNSKRDERCGCSNPTEVSLGLGCARKVCANPAFGVKEYHSCTQDARTEITLPGVVLVNKTCRTAANGPDVFKTCAHRIR